jgi:hypothetical protein
MMAKLLRLLLLAPLALVIGSGCNRTEQPARAGSLPLSATATSTESKGPTAPEGPATAQAAGNPATAEPVPVKDVTFDDIKFNHVRGTPFDRSLLTPAVNKLADKPIRIRGYILPSFQQSGIKQFVLVRDNMQCCFGPTAALYDCIVVEMADGASTDFTVRPVSVEGVFTIQEVVGAEGNPLAVYHIDGKQVN